MPELRGRGQHQRGGLYALCWPWLALRSVFLVKRRHEPSDDRREPSLGEKVLVGEMMSTTYDKAC